MRKIICISIAAIGLGMIETGTVEAQDRCKPGQVYNGRSCVPAGTRRTDPAVTNPALPRGTATFAEIQAIRAGTRTGRSRKALVADFDGQRMAASSDRPIATGCESMVVTG